jgi:hypothetical protein
MFETTNCFLAMFDILGFKALRKERGTNDLYMLYDRLILPSVQHSAALKGKSDGQGNFRPDFSDISVNYKIFSDTVIFYTKDNSFQSFVSIISSSFSLLKSGIGGGNAPYRGAISYGDLIDDQRGIFIGTAVEDAYQGETSQAWSGCMLTSDCERFAEDSRYIYIFKEFFQSPALMVLDKKISENLNLRSKCIVKYDVPMQNNPKNSVIKYFTESHYVIDWTIKMYEGASKKAFNESNDSHAQRIQENTIAFENWARKNNR